MSYEVAVSESGNYITIRVQGEITREMALRFVKEADALGAKHDLKRFLFDVREAKNTLTVLGNYQFAYEDLEQLDVDKATRTAVLTNPNDSSHDFVATTTANAGYNVRQFTNEYSALQWLLGTD